MGQELKVKSKTEIAEQEEKKDILSLYGVPEMLDRILKKEKSYFLNNMCCAGVVGDALNKLSNSDDFFCRDSIKTKRNAKVRPSSI